MQVVSTLDGKPNNGTVTLAWNGGDESYVFNYPQQNGRFETRIVSGRVLQKIGEGQWTDFGPTGQLPRTGKLADGSSSLARIASAINFEDVGNDAGLRHYRALGDLSPLDSADAGFLFGTNGAPTGVTTSLEVWVGPNGLIQRVRTAFRGTPAGRSLEAVATTELNLTEPVRILDPLATS